MCPGRACTNANFLLQVDWQSWCREGPSFVELGATVYRVESQVRFFAFTTRQHKQLRTQPINYYSVATGFTPITQTFENVQLVKIY